MTSSSESSCEAVELELAGEHVLGQRAQVGRLRVREADGDAQLVGLVGQDLLGRRRPAVEALEQPPVDRARRAHRELLADDRAHERRVDVAARRSRLGDAALVEQPREHRVGGAQVLPGVYAWPSTAPGTPVFVEYFGWIFISGRMWWTACETAIAASA